MWKVVSANLNIRNATGQEVQSRCDQPSRSQVTELFERLTSSDGGDLRVSGQPGGRDVMVAGGPSCFLVSCIGDAYGAYNLVDLSRKDRKDWLTLVVGGIPSAVEVKATVDGELAKQAILYFCDHGEIAPDLHWD
ncbi:MAG TPA: hypothetical protein VFE62_26760 [Gemmataceae bacterium]|nr:hypothetical protein [Gemmataceae bacterium]